MRKNSNIPTRNETSTAITCHHCSEVAGSTRGMRRINTAKRSVVTGVPLKRASSIDHRIIGYIRCGSPSVEAIRTFFRLFIARLRQLVRFRRTKIIFILNDYTKGVLVKKTILSERLQRIFRKEALKKKQAALQENR